MAIVKLIQDEEAPPLVRRIYEALKKTGGRVVNARRAMAHNPDFLRALGPFSLAIQKENALANRIKELAILKVSLVNGCHY